MSVDMTTEELKRLAADNRDDPQYLAALGLMVLTGRTATSLVQRALGIGYNAAARIVERIEADGIISRPNSAGKRELIERREAAAPTDNTALVKANHALGELLAFEEWQAHEGGVVPDRFIGVVNRAIAAHRAALASREAPQAATPPQSSEAVVEALKPFANMINHIETNTPDDYHPSWAEFLTVGDFRRAAAALRALKGEGDVR